MFRPIINSLLPLFHSVPSDNFLICENVFFNRDGAIIQKLARWYHFKFSANTSVSFLEFTIEMSSRLCVALIVRVIFVL